jgi:hypothetical protein
MAMEEIWETTCEKYGNMEKKQYVYQTIMEYVGHKF